MATSIDFRTADTNHNGRLDADEFKEKVLPLIKELLAKCDLNHDGYISNGKGRYLDGASEDGVDEIAELKKYGLPFDRSIFFSNETQRGAADAFSMKLSSSSYMTEYKNYFWTRLNGRTSDSEFTGPYPTGAISLLQLMENSSSLIKIDDHDRKLAVSDEWSRFFDVDSKSIFHGDGILQQEELPELLRAYARKYDPDSVASGTGLLSEKAQRAFQQDTGIRFFDTKIENGKETEIRNEDGSWRPATNLKFDDVLKMKFYFGPNNELKTSWTFYELHHK